MKEKVEQLYIDAINEDLPPDVFAGEILALFDVSVSFEHGEKLCNCPDCGAEILYGLSRESMLIIKNSRLFK